MTQNLANKIMITTFSLVSVKYRINCLNHIVRKLNDTVGKNSIIIKEKVCELIDSAISILISYVHWMD